MDAFLKEILEPSEQATFDYLTRMEAPSANRSWCAEPGHKELTLCKSEEEKRGRNIPSLKKKNKCTMRDYALPSANIGLPRHLIQRHPPRPAYTTHTSHVVKMLIRQDERRKAASHRPAETEPNSKPQEAGFEEENQVLSQLSRGSSTPGTGEDSLEMSMAESRLPSPSVCNRVIFARKPHLHVLPCSSLVRSNKKK